jgi:hypothetical protein
VIRLGDNDATFVCNGEVRAPSYGG